MPLKVNKSSLALIPLAVALIVVAGVVWIRPGDQKNDEKFQHYTTTGPNESLREVPASVNGIAWDWRVESHDKIIDTSPAQDGNYIVGMDHGIVALDTATGDERWRIQDDRFRFRAAVSEKGKTVFALLERRWWRDDNKGEVESEKAVKLLELSAVTGEIKNELAVDAETWFGGQSAESFLFPVNRMFATEDTLVISSSAYVGKQGPEGSPLYSAFDVRTGKQVWDYSGRKGCNYSNDMTWDSSLYIALKAGKLIIPYVCEEGDSVVGVDMENGEEVWETPWEEGGEIRIDAKSSPYGDYVLVSDETWDGPSAIAVGAQSGEILGEGDYMSTTPSGGLATVEQGGGTIVKTPVGEEADDAEVALAADWEYDVMLPLSGATLAANITDEPGEVVVEQIREDGNVDINTSLKWGEVEANTVYDLDFHPMPGAVVVSYGPYGGGDRIYGLS